RVIPRARRASRSLAPSCSPGPNTSCLLRRSSSFVGPVAIHPEHLSGLAALVRPDDTPNFHHIDEPGGPGVADAEAALNHGHRRMPLLPHEPDRLLEKFVLDLIIGSHGRI